MVFLPELRSVPWLCTFILNKGEEVHRVLTKHDQTLDGNTDHKIFFGRSLQSTANTSCPQTTIRHNINSSYALLLRIPLLLPTGLSSEEAFDASWDSLFAKIHHPTKHVQLSWCLSQFIIEQMRKCYLTDQCSFHTKKADNTILFSVVLECPKFLFFKLHSKKCFTLNQHCPSEITDTPRKCLHWPGAWGQDRYNSALI